MTPFRLQDLVENIEDEAQGELIEMIDVAEVLEDEECRATCLHQRQILGGDLINFLHDHVCFFDLLRNLRGFSLESFKGINDFIVIEDVA